MHLDLAAVLGWGEVDEVVGPGRATDLVLDADIDGLPQDLPASA
jgi:hypothetical protein